MTLIALLVRWPKLTYFLVAVVPGVILFNVYRHNFSWARYFAIVLSVYLPAVQGFFYESSHCQRMWPELFPVASGIVPAFWAMRFFDFERLGTGVEWIAAALCLMCWISFTYFIAGINRLCLIIVIILSLVFSTVSSFWLVALLHA